jgi:hypothetical protein
LLDAHQVIIGQVRKLARRAGELGDDGTNDLVVSEVLRRNELQVWFLSEHSVDAPLVHAEPVHAKGVQQCNSPADWTIADLLDTQMPSQPDVPDRTTCSRLQGYHLASL